MRLGDRHIVSICICGLLLLVFPVAGLGCGSDKSKGATLIIETIPEDGAGVVIGRRGYGLTPLTITDLPMGQYWVILDMYGYKRKTQPVALPSEGEIRIVVEMEPLLGYLTLESNPPRAQVYLNGIELVGETPIVKKPLKVGTYTYELRLEDYHTAKSELTVEEDFVYSFSHALVARDGRVQFFSRPSGAQVYINDNLQEETTPFSLGLFPGTYTVGVYAKGFILKEETVEVLPNGEHQVDIRLEKGEMPPGMVLVPAGDFTFGVNNSSPDEGPARKVNLDAFYIDKFEVTNEQFAQVFPGHVYGPEMENHPVLGVTWRQATEYAATIGKRLPTEQEWEKAARGADAYEWPWGNKFDPELCNLFDGREKKLDSVGTYRGGASPYGAMDMAGNAYEWTSDWYQPYEGNTEITVEYGQVFRVLRGGSFNSDSFEVRSAKRHFDKMESAREDYGFRCVQDVPDAPRSSGQG